MNHQPAPLSADAREVIDTSQWFSIATTGPDGPRLAACWTRNILKLGYSDDEIVVPVWRLAHTGENLFHASRQSESSNLLLTSRTSCPSSA